MIKRILYSSPLFSGIFWVGLLTLAIPLSWRIVTGVWAGDADYDSNATPVGIVVACLWLLIWYLRQKAKEHFARMDEEEAAAVAEPAPPPESLPTERPSQASPPGSLPRLGGLPPEVMWKIYNHAILLHAKDLQWRRDREEREKREKPQP